MEKKLSQFFPLVFLLLFTFLVFQAWFHFQPLAARDWLFFFPQSLKEFSIVPQLWDNQGWEGMGRVNLYNWSFFYFSWPAKFFSLLGFSWPVIEKIIWFWPFLILGLFSSAFLFRSLFPKNKFWFFSCWLFLGNTFALMMTGGGQMGVALAYALSPLVVALFIKSLNSRFTVRSLLWVSLVLACQLMFDSRIFYLTVLITGLYFSLCWFWERFNCFRLLGGGLFLGAIVLGLNFFWLLPALLTRSPVLPATYGETGWVQFLSFARFSDSLSLRHPFWPENIFGKTYFFQPAFLIFPIIAFGGLLFLRSSRSKNKEARRVQRFSNLNVFFFAFLALIGAFLAKGSNPPFGEVYLWLFKKVPGFKMFRDPVKFYLWPALAYSVLVPVGIESIYRALSLVKSKGKTLANLFFLSATTGLLFTLKPAFFSEIGGTLRATNLPADYQFLADFLAKDRDFGRVFWLPRREHFGFSSLDHPPVWAEEFISETREKRPFSSLLTDRYDFLSYWCHPAAREIFRVLGLKYAVVPFDSQGEIFLTDRQFDPRQYRRLTEVLDRVPWLKRQDSVSTTGFYEADFETRHFFPVRSTFFVVGPDDFYASVSGSPQFRLSDFGFYFLEEGLGIKPEPEKGDFLIFNGKEKEDLALSFLEGKFVYPFFPFLREKNTPGWEAIDLANSARTSGFDNLGFDFGQNLALSRDGGSFVFRFDLAQEGEYELWVRILTSRLGGEIQLGLDANQVIKLETREEKDGLVWKRLKEGEFLSQGNHCLEIRNRRGLNALNLLAVIPRKSWEEYQKKAEEYLAKTTVLSFAEGKKVEIPTEIFERELPQVNSRRLSLTKYSVRVEQASQPFWLVFSETFHPLWRARVGEEEIAPIKLFSLINGFYIDRTGDFEIEVEFLPQKYVYWGMLGSGLTLLFILYSLAKLTSFSKVIASALSRFRTA